MNYVDGSSKMSFCRMREARMAVCGGDTPGSDVKSWTQAELQPARAVACDCVGRQERQLLWRGQLLKVGSARQRWLQLKPSGAGATWRQETGNLRLGGESASGHTRLRSAVRHERIVPEAVHSTFYHWDSLFLRSGRSEQFSNWV